jgi:RNA-directed DNA polymerase
MQRGRCPLCGQLLLHAEVEPQHPDEWQQWITATAKAIRHHAIIVDSGSESLGYTAFRLIHTHCRGRRPDRIGVHQHPAIPTEEPSGLA